MKVITRILVTLIYTEISMNLQQCVRFASLLSIILHCLLFQYLEYNFFLSYFLMVLQTSVGEHFSITRKMVPIKGQAKVKLFDVHALCHFDVHTTQTFFSIGSDRGCLTRFARSPIK